MNDSYQLVWATDDEIGIYVNEPSWSQKNQPFILDKGAGTTTGEFKWEGSGSFSENATAAFFPWEGNGSDKNNVYNGTMFFKMREGYYGYTSGKMLTPLVASLSGSTDDIKFKHAGAAIKVTINNLPAGVHSIGMTVDGQQINGDFSINPANAGTDALALVSPGDHPNSVWLNITPANEARAFTFIFPVPTLTSPKLSFRMYDKNDVLVWSKNLKAQDFDLRRADVLVMPAIDITPYSQFSESTEWTLYGTINGSAWGDFPMCTDGTVCILSGVAFKAGDAFKIRKNKAWDESYPGSNYEINSDCIKDVWFNISTHEITLKDAGCPYPTYQNQ